jgi:hypothetical protein
MATGVETMRVLKALESGQISAEQAARLLEAPPKLASDRSLGRRAMTTNREGILSTMGGIGTMEALRHLRGEE